MVENLNVGPKRVTVDAGREAQQNHADVGRSPKLPATISLVWGLASVRKSTLAPPM